MDLSELITAVTTEVDRWGALFSPDHVALDFQKSNPRVMGSTTPIIKNNPTTGAWYYDYKLTFYTDHWTDEAMYDLTTESGVYWNLKSLKDTVRHELAHVLHIHESEPLIRQTAMSWSGRVDALTMVGGYRRSMRGANSDHGPEWKKRARQLLAMPYAAHRFY